MSNRKELEDAMVVIREFGRIKDENTQLRARIAELEAQQREDGEHILKLIADIRYIAGIAERGRGYPLAVGERITDAVLGYVKHLEAQQRTGVPELVAEAKRKGNINPSAQLIIDLLAERDELAANAAPSGEGQSEDARPMQPVVRAADGIIRFKENRIVSKLLDHATNHGYGMNQIAMGDFTKEEHMQLAQLIGYSVSGYGSLSYASDESVERADALADALAATQPAKESD